MYEIGEYIVYGNHGVCRVEDVGSLDISGIDKSIECYTLQPVFSKSSTLYTPVDNDKVLMRRVITNDEAQELIDWIKDSPLLWIENDKQREEAYKDALRKHDCMDWVKIIKTLYVRKQERLSQGKKLTFTDEKYLAIAQDFLYGELSIAMEMDREEIEEMILGKLEQLNMV
ncbi:MAG: CarD family transcriptional regulator [Clostridiales bacterium]|jgi:CarD family transcriptional regulator|nr:CarD family transcriptional regulator [Clostridiales bacterium]